MYRILMLGMSPNLAGTEAFIYNYYKTFDKEKIQVDFVKRTEEKIVHEDEIIKNGSKVFYIPQKRKDYKAYKESMKNFFEKNAKDYDAIWDNTMLLSNIDFLVYAKKYGIKDIIVHSHISSTSNKGIKRILHEINKRRLSLYANRFFACSEVAADFLYSGKSREKAFVINNAINIEDYQYNENKKNSLINDYNLIGKKIVGTIGRSSAQKNHIFLVDIAKSLVDKSEDFVIVIVGNDSSSQLHKELEEKIKENNLEKYFLSVGSQKDIKAWLSLFDVFILPSLFEGLPFVAVEAQANGVPTILSTGISKETKITENVKYIDLNSDINEWSTSIVDSLEKERTDINEVQSKFAERGYILEVNCKKIEKLLLENKGGE